jgi:hypothetical protein
MAKLEKRQMIVLGVMVVVILYGAYDFLSSKKKSPVIDTAQKTSELKTLVTDLTASMEKDSATNPSALIFSRAEQEWTQDPFLDSKSYSAWASISKEAKAGAEASKKIDFVYSGYLGLGKKRMAVINGMEYKEGDALDIRGFVLKSISPARVVIENSGTRAKLDIPLQD